MITIRFDDVFRIVLDFEGGYSNDPNDRGGATNLGITEGTLRSAQAKGWVPQGVTVRTLTVDHAKTIYRRGYWNPVKGDSAILAIHPESIYGNYKNSGVWDLTQVYESKI